MDDRIIAEYSEDRVCNGMDRKRIVKELYAHAIGYYLFLNHMGEIRW